MDEYESSSDAKWDCKDHVIFIPGCRREELHGELREHLGEAFRYVAAQDESRIEQEHFERLTRIRPRLCRGCSPESQLHPSTRQSVINCKQL